MRKVATMKNEPLEIHAEGSSGWSSSAMFRESRAAGDFAVAHDDHPRQISCRRRGAA
jgi:hypothetical protein